MMVIVFIFIVVNKEVAMKINLTLSVEDALQLQRILFDCRHAMAVNAVSLRWGFPGNPDVSFGIEDIVLMEDFQTEIIAAVDDIADHIHFAGCCNCL